MKFSLCRISILALAILGAGTFAVMKLKPEVVPEPVKIALAPSSNLKSFEFLGCSGDWTDEKIEPQAWMPGRKGKITFLIKHPADCGYTIASNPKAIVSGTSIDFSYSMSNDDGSLAACYCEYWAEFELKSTPDKVTKISFDGAPARLMGDLGER